MCTGKSLSFRRSRKCKASELNEPADLGSETFLLLEWGGNSETPGASLTNMLGWQEILVGKKSMRVKWL